MEPQSQSNESLAFNVQWFDPAACIIRYYKLVFHTADNCVEMYDLKNQRTFLRRSRVDHIKVSDLYLGNTITVCSRQLLLSEFADKFTENRISSKQEKTVAILYMEEMKKLGEIIMAIEKEKLKISRCRMMFLNRTDVLPANVSPGEVVAIELVGRRAVTSWRDLAATHGGHAPGLRAEAEKISSILFPTDGRHMFPNTAKLANSTCCIIKPHAITEGLTGNIITDVQRAGFHITSMGLFHMEKVNVEEFYEIYKGIVPEYMMMVSQLSSGPCLAMEISFQDESREFLSKTFRDFVGPSDPDLARQLRPQTLRGKYGTDKVLNAIHCSDLAEDGPLEVEYFFRILDH